MTKSNHSLAVQLRRDLFAAYRDVTSKPCPTQTMAWIRTVRHPAPRFYVSSKRAANAMSDLINGNLTNFNKLSKMRQAMYIELYNIVLQLSQKKEFIGKPLKYIVSFAIAQPASSFFVPPRRFREIFRNAKRYGIEYHDSEVRILNRQYTNHKDNKPSDAVFKGKKHLIMNL